MVEPGVLADLRVDLSLFLRLGSFLYKRSATLSSSDSLLPFISFLFTHFLPFPAQSLSTVVTKKFLLTLSPNLVFLRTTRCSSSVDIVKSQKSFPFINVTQNELYNRKMIWHSDCVKCVFLHPGVMHCFQENLDSVLKTPHCWVSVQESCRILCVFVCWS